MNIENRYLSDEELEQLIFVIEQNELVSAPPEFMNKVLVEIEHTTNNPSLQIHKVLSGEDEELASCESVLVHEQAANTEAEHSFCKQQNVEIILQNINKQIMEENESCKKQAIDKQEISIADARKKKMIEFRKYCIRVITSAAAAIAILFALPNMKVVRIREFPSREKLIGKTISREEVLADTGFFDKIMDGLYHQNIEYNKFHDFNKIGGYSNETEKKE